jgi:hypothetical protein
MTNDSSVAQGEDVSLDTQLVNWVTYLTFRGTHTTDVTAGRVTGLINYVDDLKDRQEDTHPVIDIGRATTTRDAAVTLQQTEQGQYRLAAQKIVDEYMKKHSVEYASNEIELTEAVDKIVEKLIGGCLTICENQIDAEETTTCHKHAVMRLAELMVHGHSLGDYFGDNKLTPLTWADSPTSYRKQA